MLRKLKIGVSISLMLALSISTTAFAQGRLGSAAEAKAMLEKAVVELKANEAAALAKFNKGEGGFKDRDLYVFCFDMIRGQFTAHIDQPLIGADVNALTEMNRSPLGEKLFNMANARDVRSVAYNFPKPGGTDPVAKEAYVTRIGNQGCGVRVLQIKLGLRQGRPEWHTEWSTSDVSLAANAEALRTRGVVVGCGLAGPGSQETSRSNRYEVGR